MPMPNEEETLSTLLAFLNDQSEETSKMRIQTISLLIASLTFMAVIVVCSMYNLISFYWLLILSCILGMCLMGLIISRQIKCHTQLLKPYIDVDAISARIDELKT